MAVAPIDHSHPTDVVYEQYITLEQQQESYIVGMWTFLVTEVMFFGALFLIYTLYRFRYQEAFYEMHKDLNVTLGGINTMNLLFSSFMMALAVHFAQLKDKMKQLACLSVVELCAGGFLVIKYIEYSAKFEHHLFPGAFFQPPKEAIAGHFEGAASCFFSLYFAMTGLHGVHVLIGMLCIGALMFFVATDHKVITDYIPTEMIGLYWHFVDIVWIFLFPLYYLIPAVHH